MKTDHLFSRVGMTLLEVMGGIAASVMISILGVAILTEQLVEVRQEQQEVLQDQAMADLQRFLQATVDARQSHFLTGQPWLVLDGLVVGTGTQISAIRIRCMSNTGSAKVASFEQRPDGWYLLEIPDGSVVATGQRRLGFDGELMTDIASGEYHLSDGLQQIRFTALGKSSAGDRNGFAIYLHW
jgi:hypothetical protein